MLKEQLSALKKSDTVSHSQLIKLSKRLYSEAERKNDTSAMCLALMNQAHNYTQLRAFDIAHRLMVESYTLSESLENHDFSARIQLLFGNYFLKLAQIDKAEKYFNRGLNFLELEDPFIQPSLMYGKGLCMFHTGRYDSALIFFKNASKSAEDSNLSQRYVNTYKNMEAQAYISLEEFSRSFEIIQHIIKNTEIGSNNATHRAFRIKATWYKQQGMFDSALHYLYLSNSYSSDASTLWSETENRKDMASVYAELGIPDSANAIYERVLRSYQTIFNQKSQDRIDELQTLFELGIKEQKLKEAQAQIDLLAKNAKIKTLKFYLAAGLGISLMMLVALGLVFYRKQKQNWNKKNELAQQLAESEKKEKEYARELLEFKNKDLTDFAINLRLKTDELSQFREKQEGLLKINSLNKLKSELKDLIFDFKTKSLVNKQAKVFLDNVEKVNHEFFEKLQKDYPKLTRSDLELSSMIRLKLSNKEIAILKNTSDNTVKTAKHRLKKKLNLSQKEDLEQFIQSY